MSNTSKTKKRHLGKGLEALLGNQSQSTSPTNIEHFQPDLPRDPALRTSLRSISIEEILPNPYQPRTSWDESELTELADSIRANGLIQPIIVRKKGTSYELIAGERRLKAASMAGLTELPAIIREASDEEMLELALVENIHRTDLNPIERARAYQNYLDTFTLNQTEAANRLGEDRSVISNYLRLLDLPSEVQQMLIDRRLTMGHARALLSLPSDEAKHKLAKKAHCGRLSVREVERMVRRAVTTGDIEKTTPAKPAHVADLESRLRETLGTKVTIDARKNGQRGRIIIEFYSLDEFDRLSEKIGLSHTDQ